MDNQQKTTEALRDEVFAATVALFEGNQQAAEMWLNQPLLAIGNAVPVVFMDSPERIETVRNIIGRLEHGVWT